MLCSDKTNIKQYLGRDFGYYVHLRSYKIIIMYHMAVFLHYVSMARVIPCIIRKIMLKIGAELAHCFLIDKIIQNLSIAFAYI